MKLALIRAGFAAIAVSVGMVCCPAFARDGLKGTTLVIASGTCSQFTISGQSYPSCSPITYFHTKTHRVGWFFAMPHREVLMLAGSRDKHFGSSRYIFQVDELRMQRVNSNKPQAAYGECSSRDSPDGVFLYSLRCFALSGDLRVIIKFSGNGQPVYQKTF